LFLGNEKYQDESEYQNFVNSHGGNSNAFTTFENTNYYFDVSHEYLEPSLDRFAQFFICPTFTESATFREMNAVNSEFEKNKTQDNWRMNHFNQSIANPKHPYSKFMIGNLKSLKEDPLIKNIDVRSALLDFHKRYYSADIMKLVILGRETLEELQDMAKSKFSGVKNTGNSVKHFPGYGLEDPFLKEQRPEWYNVVPKSDIHKLIVYWPIKSYLKNYEEKPTRYLGHILGHEADGTLFAYLKKKGWAMELMAGSTTTTEDMELFGCHIALTEDGLEKIEQIIMHIYQYLKIIREFGVQKYLYDEVQEISDMEFKFLEKLRPSSYTSNLAQQIHKYPEQEVLIGPYLFRKFEPELINSILNELIPSNMIVQVISKQFEGSTDLKENWYDIDYTKITIPEDFLQSLFNPEKPPEELYIPPPNEFIPKDFSIKKDKIIKHPEIIRDTPLSQIWHICDTTYLKPKAFLFFHLISPQAYTTPTNFVLTSLFFSLVDDSLNEKYTYNAEIAGLKFSLSTILEGALLKVSGFNEKIHLLMKKIIERIATYQVSEDRFSVIKEQRTRDFENIKRQQPYQISQFKRKLILYQKFWSPEEKMQIIKGLTVKDLKNFIPILLSSLKIRGLAQGNITSNEILSIVDDMETILKPTPMFPSQYPEQRLVKLKKGMTYLHQSLVPNQHDNNSVVWVEYQIGSGIRSDSLLELLSHILEVPFYEQIRTKEQLGYLVWSFHHYDCGISHLCFCVQSPQKDPIYLNERIDVFLKEYEKVMENLSDEEFTNQVKAVISSKLENFPNLAEEVKYNWEEISNLTFLFNRKFLYADEFKKISKQELLQFYREKISSSETSKRVSLQIFGNKCTLIPTDSSLEKSIFSIKPSFESEFKGSMPLYPARTGSRL